MTKQLNTNQLERLADLSAREEVLLKVSTTAGIRRGFCTKRGQGGAATSPQSSQAVASGENRLKRDAEKPQRNLFVGVLPPIVSNTILAAK